MKMTEAWPLSWPLRTLIIAALARLVLSLAGPAVRSLTVVGLLDVAVNLLLAATLSYFVFVLLRNLLRRLLWRVRRKLILSYVFIGLIPVVLIVGFFVLAGTLTLLSVSSFLVKLSLDDLVSEATAAAGAVAGELRALPAEAAQTALARHQQSIGSRHPDAALALVRAGHETPRRNVFVGSWPAAGRPVHMPAWLQGEQFEGLVAVRVDNGVRVVARAAQRVGDVGELGLVVVDLPVDESVAIRIRNETGVEVREAAIVALAGEANASDAPVETTPADTFPLETSEPLATVAGLSWFSFLDHTDWETGERQFVALEIGVPPTAFYERVFGAQARIGDVSLGYAFLIALAAVGTLFLIIEFTALVMGFALAKSITGSVHELFVGTEHVRRGDFGHRILVKTRDQLGELAESFNAMTGSVKDLLQQADEKKRLEEELRIAREIQMSLLPHETTSIPGVSVTAVCIPAREVGGDYYDLIRLGERRLGVLVADVSGKGTSAAFYMAELKGLILSLSPIYQSPRQLLIEVNRIMAENIDARSFITMLYAVIDLEEQTLTYARAGHTPLLYLAGSDGAGGAQVLTPSGLVVGLEGFQRTFEDLLEEHSIGIGAGDLAVLFTDGITEAMNEDAELFGEDRLSRLIEEHTKLGCEELRARILGDIEAFVGNAAQHDDMTMVLLKIDSQVANLVHAGATRVG